MPTLEELIEQLPPDLQEIDINIFHLHNHYVKKSYGSYSLALDGRGQG